MNKNISLMVGTASNGKGGIATVVTSYKDKGLFEECNIRYIATHRQFPLGFFGRFCSLLLYAFAFLRIFYYLIFYRVDIVHIHMSSRGSYTRKSLLVDFFYFLNVPTLIHLHGSEFQVFYNNECSENKKQRIRNTFKKADKVIVLSTQWRSWVGTITNIERVTILYNGVDRIEPALGERYDQIAFLGRVGNRKGTFDLINAFAIAKASCPSLTLKIAGDGEVEEARKLINELGLADSIELLGWVSGQARIELIKQSGIYCLPSYNEGFPMGVVEAMSAGKFIISSYSGGIPDAIEHNRDGLLIDAGDIEALSRCLEFAVKNKDEANSMKVASKARFESEFHLDIILTQLKGIYSDVKR